MNALQPRHARLNPQHDGAVALDPRHPSVTPDAIAALLGNDWVFAGGRPHAGRSWELTFAHGDRRTEAVVVNGRASFRRAGQQWGVTLARLAEQIH